MKEHSIIQAFPLDITKHFTTFPFADYTILAIVDNMVIVAAGPSLYSAVVGRISCNNFDITTLVTIFAFHPSIAAEAFHPSIARTYPSTTMSSTAKAFLPFEDTDPSDSFVTMAFIP